MAGRTRSKPEQAEEQAPEQTPETPEPAPETTPEATENAPFALPTLVRSAGITRARKNTEPSPTNDAVIMTLTEGPLAYPAPDDEAVKKLVNWLQRSAVEINAARKADGEPEISLSKSVDALADGTFLVNFQAKTGKREAKYTADDVRAWAKDQGFGDFTGVKIPKEVRTAYRVAHGYEKEKEKVAAKA